MSIICSLYDLSQATAWGNALETLDVPVYYSWEYCQALSETKQEKISLFKVQQGTNTLIGTFAIRKKLSGYTDLYHPYGFGGLAYFGRKENADELYNEWIRFAKQKNYISGYFGVWPFTIQNSFVQTRAQSYHEIYVMDLNASHDELWKGMSKGHRYEIKKNNKNTDLVISSDKDRLFDHFLQLHSQTLNRVGAGEVYYFSESTLRSLVYQVPSTLMGAIVDGEVQAVVLFLHTDKYAEYFISVASEEGKTYTRNLVWKGIEEYQQQGVSYLHLGGGVVPRDSLAQFKSRFGAKTLPYRVVKEIYHADRFNELCRRFKVDEQSNDFFPPYWNPKIRLNG